jgi:hypothetical protein
MDLMLLFVVAMYGNSSIASTKRWVFAFSAMNRNASSPPDKTMCPEVDSALENEYQGFLLG